MELILDHMLQQGVSAHSAGNLKEAERLYSAILQAQPKHPEASHNLGLVLVSLNQPEVAQQLFKNAIVGNPNIEQFWLSYIDLLITERHFEETKRALKKAKKKGVAKEKLKALTQKLALSKEKKAPSQAQMQELMNHYQNGRHGDAEKLALIITHDFPKHQFGWKILGLVFAQTEKKFEALNANQKAVQLDLQDAEAQSNLANTFKELGRLEEAEASYRQAIKLKPDFSEIHNNLGTMLRESNRLEDADVSYRQAIKLKPDFPEAHRNLGITLRALHKIEEAEASYRQAIKLKPDYAEAHNNLGITLQDQGRLEEAKTSYTQAIALKSDFALARYNLGNTLKELGRLEEAEASYIRAIALKPDFADSHSNLGVTLQELGRLEEAKTSYTQAIALKPDKAEAHNNLGVTLQELGRLEEAEASFAQAIALTPDEAEAYNNLGVTLQELGRLEEAEERYSQAIALKPDDIDAFMNRWDLLFKKREFKAALENTDFWNTKLSRQRSLETLYELGRIDEIYQRIEIQSEIDDGNLGVAAFASFIAKKEKKDTAHNFCRNPLDFLHFANVSSYLQDTNAFIQAVVEELHDVKTIWEPSKRSTRKGFQTSMNMNLFANPTVKMQHLKSIIEAELDSYYLKFRNKACSFIQKWPTEKNLLGWHVILKHQGYQTAHIHPDGWLSGVIYLKIVPSLGRDEGAIEFSLNGQNYSDNGSPTFVHQPTLGDIVLFPSSLHHRTIPFTTDTDRIIVSFDLRPEAE